MATENGYNGWKNYETWLMSLWIGNEQWMDEEVSNMAYESRRNGEEIYQLADQIKSWIEDFPEVSEVQEKAGFVSDLLNAAMGEIDWYEIAEHYIQNLDPEEVE